MNRNQNYNFVVKLTLNCPGNCACCTNRQKSFLSKKDSNKPFDIKIYKKICNNIVKLNGSYVCISGGEPTIVPNIDEYIKIANDCGLSVRINTNGWSVTEEKLNCWLDNGLDQVVLSVYSIDPEIMLLTRGNPEIYNRTMRAAEILKNAHKSRKFMYIMQTIIMKNNYREIPDLLSFAIDNGCDRFWPSYLEDACNLPGIRMLPELVKEFRGNVIPKMQQVIQQKIVDKEKAKELIEAAGGYYDNPFDNYIYHAPNEYCKWSGSHFTFYPNGTVDPCPGHEYFSSPYQFHIDYDNIDEFMTLDSFKKWEGLVFDYCQYCPQGKHREINLGAKEIHEHAGRNQL